MMSYRLMKLLSHWLLLPGQAWRRESATGFTGAQQGLLYVDLQTEAYILVRVLVSGACGRMGQAVVKAVMEDAELTLVGAVDLKGGADAGELVGMGKSGVISSGSCTGNSRCKPEVIVDFTRPDVVFNVPARHCSWAFLRSLAPRDFQRRQRRSWLR